MHIPSSYPRVQQFHVWAHAQKTWQPDLNPRARQRHPQQPGGEAPGHPSSEERTNDTGSGQAVGVAQPRKGRKCCSPAPRRSHEDALLDESSQKQNKDLRIPPYEPAESSSSRDGR